MQAQKERVGGEKIGELTARLVSMTIKEISPSGIRLEVNSQGEVKGRYDATHIETASLLLKLDDSYEWETKAIETTREGDTIVAWGGGHGRSTGTSKTSWEGEIQYMTRASRLSWLNNTTVSVEGTFDRTTGEIHGRSYSHSAGKWSL